MYKRILLKLSGEALKEKTGMQIIDVKSLDKIAQAIGSIYEKDIEICVVIGAGNIWRGKLAKDIGAKKAYLKTKSPMCGSGQIYDGSFKGKLIDGDGVLTKLLKNNGIEIIAVE